MKRNFIFLLLFLLLPFQNNISAQHSVAREWNEALLHAIRNDFARPTVHARNLFHTSAAMFDAWAIYDDEATPFLLGNTVGDYTCFYTPPFNMPTDIEAAREEAISFAAYRLLRHRFQNAPPGNVADILESFDDLMIELGYDINNQSLNYPGGDPAAMGNYIAACYIAFGQQDNANEPGYGNTSYQPVNPPLVTNFPGNPDLVDPNRWQPLTLSIFIDQAGNEIPFNTPPFLSPEWGQVVPFALSEEDLTIYERDGFDYWVYHDPGPPPLIDPENGGDVSDEYKWGFSLVVAWSAQLDPTDGEMIDISPGSQGNQSVLPSNIFDYREFYSFEQGGDPSQGHDMNPVTGMPYEPNIVPRGDYGRVLAEFWADGPDSETPPGHWFTLLNYVNDHPMFEKRFKGEGDILDDLEWDVKAYFLLGGGMHDTAVSIWGIKGWYDYIRPIGAIRGMIEKGQCSDENLPNYDLGGIPLYEGYIEMVEMGDPLAGDNNEHVGKVKVKSWKGPDYVPDPVNTYAGVDWILGENWWPYQRPSFVTPNFAAYLSGHSGFSRAAAEIMTALTGDPFFPGGMGEFVAPQNEFLVFEDGPSQDIVLQWATYRDASDQTSLSRIWGGIHPPADDIPGRLIGMEIAEDAFNKAETYFFRDDDNDGFLSYEDCDDNNPNINPAASELCNGIDDNCDGNNDEGIPKITYYRDIDEDGFGNILNTVDTCIMTPPFGFVTNGLDCNDNNPNINPNATEICDAIDNDCNGAADDGLPKNTYYRDMDSDGYGDGGVSVDTCIMTPPMGYVANDLDCNDNDGDINPDAAEICDAIDNNCNGAADDGLPKNTYYRDMDSDGFGDGGVPVDTCIMTPPMGYVANDLDCNDNDGDINPDAAEICDAIDNNCNGAADDGLPTTTYYRDADLDGFGNSAISVDTCISNPPLGFVANDLDCNDDDGSINPDVIEICDGIDNDCNGLADDGLPVTTYYRDADNDGFGDLAVTADTCITTPPTGYVANDQDCDDTNANIFPGAEDIPDNDIDEDCNGFDLFKTTKLFPNPVRNELTIHYDHEGEVTIQIVSSDARVVKEITHDFQNNNVVLDMNNFSAGVYWIVFIGADDKRLFVEKIVKN